MGAGCVIHLCHEENDIYRMGGVRRKSPFVFWMFLAGALCLAGLPFSGGFFSKDGILLAAFAQPGPWFRLAWLLGAITALLTSLYTFRLLWLVFAGEARKRAHPHELPGLMRWTLPPLALLGLGGGLLNLPPAWGGGELLHHWLGRLGGELPAVDHALEFQLAGLAAALFLAGAALATWRYRRFAGERTSKLKHFLLHGWQADRLVDRALVRPFTAIGRFFWIGLDRTLIEGVLETLAGGAMREGETLRRMTSGRVSTYLAGFAWGLLALLLWFLLALAKGAGPHS